MCLAASNVPNARIHQKEPIWSKDVVRQNEIPGENVLTVNKYGTSVHAKHDVVLVHATTSVSCPTKFTPDAHSRRGWVGSRGGLNALEKGKISYPYREWNTGSSNRRLFTTPTTL